MASNPDKLDQEYLEYLQSKVKQRGKITLQNLSGHLSQVSPEIRRRFGTSPKCLKSFLNLHPDIFEIKGDDLVMLTVPKEENSKDNITNSIETIDMAGKDTMPHHLSEVKGKIFRLFPQFGFISITEPCKTTVYFDGAKFGDGSCTYLEDLKLKVGQAVLLNAIKMPKGKGADYRALKVWLPSNSSNMKNMSLHESSKSVSQTSLESFSEDAELYRIEGTIQKLFDKYGFINFRKNPGSVFFHMSNIAKCPIIGNEVKLSDFLKRGDPVTFNAIPSKKQNIEVPWEATRVWLPASCFKKFIDKELSGDDEIFQSTSEESEEEIENSINVNHLQEVAKKADAESLAEQKNVHSNIPGQKSDDLVSLHTTTLENKIGKIFPEKSDKAVIKFKFRKEEMSAMADIEVIYLNGERAKNLMWDVDEGWEVNFNAVRDNERCWKATLVWRGHKPFTEENNKLLPSSTSKLSNDSKSSEECVITGMHDISAGDSATSSSPTPEEKVKDKKTTGDKYTTFMHSPYRYSGDWGDSPLPNSASESLQCNINDLKEKQKNKAPKNFKGDIETIALNSLKIKQNCNEPLISDTDRVINIPSRNSPSIVNSEENFQKENATSQKAVSNSTAQQCSPIVKQYSDVTGIVKNVNEYNGVIECNESHDSVPFSWNVFYVDEKHASDVSTNLTNILKESDTVHMNYFKASSGNDKWKLASLVWFGKKPKSAKEFTLDEFLNVINSQCKTNSEELSADSIMEGNNQNMPITSNKGLSPVERTQSAPLKSHLKQSECKDDEKTNMTKTNIDTTLHDTRKNNTDVPLSMIPNKWVGYFPPNQMILQASSSAVYRPPLFPQPRYFGNSPDLFFPLQDSAMYRHQLPQQLCNPGFERIVPWAAKPRMLSQVITPSSVNNNAFPINVQDYTPMQPAYSENPVLGSKTDECDNEHSPLSTVKDNDNMKDTHLKHPENTSLVKNISQVKNHSQSRINDFSVEECSALKASLDPTKHGVTDNGLQEGPLCLEENLLIQNSSQVRKLTQESLGYLLRFKVMEKNKLPNNDISDLASRENAAISQSHDISKSVTHLAKDDESFDKSLKDKPSFDSLGELGCKTYLSKLSNAKASEESSIQKTSKSILLNEIANRQFSDGISAETYPDCLKPHTTATSVYSGETRANLIKGVRETLIEMEFSKKETVGPLTEENPSLEPEMLSFISRSDNPRNIHSELSANKECITDIMLSDENDERLMKFCDLVVKRLCQKNFHFSLPSTSNDLPFVTINKPQMVDKDCQTEDNIFVNHVFGRSDMKTDLSQTSDISLRSKETQTFMTGKVLCIDIHPS